MKKTIWQSCQVVLMSFVLLIVMNIPVAAGETSNQKLSWGSAVYQESNESLQEQQRSIHWNTNQYQAHWAGAAISRTKEYYGRQLNSAAAYIYEILEKNLEQTYSGNYVIKLVVPDNQVIYASDIMEKGAYQYAIDAFKADHPEVFWLAYQKMIIRFSYYDNGRISDIEIGPSNYLDYYPDADIGNGHFAYGGVRPFNSADDVKAAKNKIEQRTAACLSSIQNCIFPYEKIKGIHDWLVSNVEYDLNYYDQSLYTTLVYGKGVCAGYVGAFDYIADRAGIETIQAVGVAYNSPTSKGENHAWNLVKLNGIWYALDITWDDPIGGNGMVYDDFLLVGTETKSDHLSGGQTFSQSHKQNNYFTSPSYSFTMPTVSKERYVPIDMNPEDYPLGDVGFDGTVGLDDAQMVLKAALRIVELKGIQIEKADVDGVEGIGLNDAQMVLKAALRVITLE